MSFAKPMQYEAEEIPLSTASKTAVKKEVKRLREANIDKMSSLAIVWYLVVKHKFSIVVTILITYVAFNSFGTLIVGLAESLVK